ncbi:MAG: ATP-binding protein [Vicinamibacteria bacterium]|nr:ATP-binding protein [Vicinamibacteria bacterium]
MRLPESDQELREFLDRTTVGLGWVGADGRFVWANQAERDLLGYAEGECVGHHFAERLVDPDVATDLLARLSHGEQVGTVQARLRARDGSSRHVLISGDALFRDGAFLHSRIVTRDITDLIQREQAARQKAEASSHLKDEFLALLSHELRSPLGAILVWLELLRQGGFDGAERERALEVIERSARALERIIEDLLHASRIAAGGLMLHPQLVDLAGVVQVAFEAAAADAALKAHALTWSGSAVPVWVRGDPGRLQQAISNVLSNAIKFTPAGGHIAIALEVTGTQARLLVSDDGEGMSDAFLPIAFERFRQQDSSSSRTHHGLGLGLYVVRHVIEHHGGVARAQSPGPGQGTTVTMELPLAVARESDAVDRDRDRDRDRDTSPAAGLSVLLVDDEQDVLEALRLILTQRGMRVTTASSAHEAYELVAGLRPDVLLSDIAMPGEDGLSLIRRVRLLPPDAGGLVPAAALSAYASAGDRRSALLAGFQHHLAKPVNPTHLLSLIERMVRAPLGIAS